LRSSSGEALGGPFGALEGEEGGTGRFGRGFGSAVAGAFASTLFADPSVDGGAILALFPISPLSTISAADALGAADAICGIASFDAGAIAVADPVVDTWLAAPRAKNAAKARTANAAPPTIARYTRFGLFAVPVPDHEVPVATFSNGSDGGDFSDEAGSVSAIDDTA
jgi:hypothetical protein